MEADRGQQYRRAIDRLVESCLRGQGQIGKERFQAGVWNPHADPESMPDQVAINQVLASLSGKDREVLAKVVEQQFISGMHEALVVLHELQIPPFEDGYEGTPFHDFVGRLDGWVWPN